MATVQGAVAILMTDASGAISNAFKAMQSSLLFSNDSLQSRTGESSSK